MRERLQPNRCAGCGRGLSREPLPEGGVATTCGICDPRAVSRPEAEKLAEVKSAASTIELGEVTG